MRIRAMILGGAVLLAGCGGSSKSGTTRASSPPTPATTSTAAAKPRSGLAERVLTNNELPGFTATEAPQVERNPRLYLIESSESGSQLATDTARLKRLGFKGAVSENLNGSGQDGLSLVEQLGSAAAARSELTGGIQQSKSQGETYRTFPVAQIPGAVGFSLSGAQGAGINIAWADGPYYYLVGETLSSLNKSSERALDAAARHLYQRTHA